MAGWDSPLANEETEAQRVIISSRLPSHSTNLLASVCFGWGISQPHCHHSITQLNTPGSRGRAARLTSPWETSCTWQDSFTSSSLSNPTGPVRRQAWAAEGGWRGSHTRASARRCTDTLFPSQHLPRACLLLSEDAGQRALYIHTPSLTHSVCSYRQTLRQVEKHVCGPTASKCLCGPVTQSVKSAR